MVSEDEVNKLFPFIISRQLEGLAAPFNSSWLTITQLITPLLAYDLKICELAKDTIPLNALPPGTDSSQRSICDPDWPAVRPKENDSLGFREKDQQEFAF